MSEWYNLSVLLGGFLLLTLLALRGHSVYVAAPLSAAIVLVLSGMDPVAGLADGFMQGFADYLRRFYLIFALGAAFGKLIEESGAAGRIAGAVSRLIGAKRACLAVVLACAVLTYGGVSLWVVGFVAYPFAVRLFRAAGLPRRFIPAAIVFGSATFTMTTAGSPQIQNLIPIQYLVDSQTGEPLTDAMAGWPASLIVAAVMFALGQWYLEWAIRKATAKGERFSPRATDAPDEGQTSVARPTLFQSLLPLIVTLAALNLLPRLLPALGEAIAGLAPKSPTVVASGNLLKAISSDPTVAILLGVLAAAIVLRRNLRATWSPISEGFIMGFLAIGATCSVVGFGAAIAQVPAFDRVVDWVTHIPGDPLIGAAVAVGLIAGLAESASGGQGLALPILKPIYIDQLGVAPRALHRIVSISSGTLDTLPANGYLVMLIKNVCGETHSSAYWPICVTCTLIPIVGTALAILLFKLFPAWAMM